MTKIIGYALAFESFLNLFGAIPFLLYPEWCLSYVVNTLAAHHVHTSPVPPGSATLFQVYACLVIALTIPLLMCIPDVPGAAPKRVIMFQALGMGEAFLIALLLWKATDPDKSGYTQLSLVLSAMSLTPHLSWRAWTLLVRPDWFADGSETKKKQT